MPAMTHAHATEWEVLPPAGHDPQAIAERCRKLVRRRAMVAAGVAMVPLPGLDWLTDVGILVELLPRINAEFGLSAEQIERLAPDRRIVVYKAISAGGGMLIGKVVTRDLVLWMLKLVGVRLTTQQAAKFVPLAGQAVSAALTYSALRYVCEQHIRQCIEVSRLLALPAPAAAATRVDEVSPAT
jgi:uncharacterized protein (DUF697 family)